MSSSSRIRGLTRLWHIIPASKALWWVTLPPISARTNPHNMGMNFTRHTVLHFCIQLGKNISVVDVGLLNVPHRSLFHDIPHQKKLWIALSFRRHFLQFKQRMNMTCPQPCSLQLPFLRLNVIAARLLVFRDRSLIRDPCNLQHSVWRFFK